MTVDPPWRAHAARLADQLTHPAGRWREPVRRTARHALIPRWWQRSASGAWRLVEGERDTEKWVHAAYSATGSLVTQIGASHADHARPDEHPDGQPASSGTNPYLVMAMLRHARIHDGSQVLDVGTGPGYNAGLLARRLGDDAVTSLDADPYIAQATAERLAAQGLSPRVECADALGPLEWHGDRIIAMTSVPGVPASWLASLATGGRLVCTIAGTWAVVTAVKRLDGTASGKIEYAAAGFMHARRAGQIQPPADADPHERPGARPGASPFPVVDVASSAELQSVFGLRYPGVRHRYREAKDGLRTAWMDHADGSWARAVGLPGQPASVLQAGPRRLWDGLEHLRGLWLDHGSLGLYGTEVHIEADGTLSIGSRAGWSATVPGIPSAERAPAADPAPSCARQPSRA